jgi:IclR family acetate operon transcriptional repressor
MPSPGSSTVDKALRVLEVLHQHSGALSLGRLASELEVPKATAHRLLGSLSAHDLVESDGEGHYGLGMGLVRLGLGSLEQSAVEHAARTELEEAAAQLGETFFLVAARARRLWVLARAEGHAVLRAVPSLGTEVPVIPTASGRLYLAYAPELVSAPAAAVRKIRPRIERARARGYDVNDGEWIERLRVVAAPIASGDTMHGCVACAGAKESLDGQAGEQAIRHTREVAGRIAAKLSGEAPIAARSGRSG